MIEFPLEHLKKVKPKLELVANSSPSLGIRGLLAISQGGHVLASLGVGADPRVLALVTELDWLATAARKRRLPVLVLDRKLVAFVTEMDGDYLVLLSEGQSDTVMRFLLNVDFAYDVIDHVLTDPNDSMVVVNANEELVFMSPEHEKSLGLQPGECAGLDVQQVFDDSRLSRVLRTGVAEVGQSRRIQGRERVESRHPIRHQGSIVGAIGRSMYKDSQQVVELARRVDVSEQPSSVGAPNTQANIQRQGQRVLDAIIGESAAIQLVRQQILKVAPLDVPVLIQGGSGTGKELVAAALHALSPRHGGRFVAVNAAALPATLVESELFGYEAGSFTGADRKGRPGKFELADRGTIFLDEIGDMPLEVQAKLLRVLQDRCVERVGGDKPKRVDFRLCTATHCDLEALVDRRNFRLDLYYRISPVRIVLPTLEERTEDIPLLLNHFVCEMATQYDRAIPEIAADVSDFLMGRSWPGNIRQLQHAVHRAFVFSEEGRLRVADFEQDTKSAGAPGSSAVPLAIGGQGPVKVAVDQLERDLIADAMTRFKGNKKKAAVHLGISRSYLYKKLKEDSALASC